MGGFVGIGANGAAASAAANGALDAVQRLRTAAVQQQQRDQQQAQRDFNDELEIRKAGGVPYNDVTVQPQKATSTTPGQLGRRDAQPGVDPSRLVTDTRGRKWLMPDGKAMTPAQQQTATHENTGDLLTALKAGGQPVSPDTGNVFQNGDIPRMSMPATGPADSSNLVNTGGSGINVAPPHPEQVQNIGGKQVYMPSEGETAETKLRQKVSETEGVQNATQDAQGWVLPDALAAAAEKASGGKIPAGSLRGVKLPHEVVADAFRRSINPDKETPDKPDAQQVLPGVTGPKGGLVVFDKNTQTTTEVPLPKGSRRELTPAQVEVQARAAERVAAANQGVVERLQEKQDKLGAEAKQYRDLADQYQGQVGAANGDNYTDPMDRSRMARKVTAGSRTAMAQGVMKANSKAEALEKQAASFAKQIEARQAKNAPAAAGPAAAPQGGPDWIDQAAARQKALGIGKGAMAPVARQRAVNPQTKQVVEWDGKAWIPTTP